MVDPTNQTAGFNPQEMFDKMEEEDETDWRDS